MSARRYYGTAAHFIGGESCRFHIATLIGDVLVSTVGDYRTSEVPGAPARDIGYNRKYETMAFKVDGECECGCGLPSHNGNNIDFAGYQTAGEANAGHEAMCTKYESPMLAGQGVE